MAIKIYREESKELKTPMIKHDSYGSFFCTNEGLEISWYVSYAYGASPNCEQTLREKGYRTDFAAWDSLGVHPRHTGGHVRIGFSSKEAGQHVLDRLSDNCNAYLNGEFSN